MATIKKAILSLFIMLLILLGLTQIAFSVNTGKAKEDANLRKSMDNTSTILEIIPKGDEFEVLEDQGDWYRVNYKKIRGYVKKEQVEFTKQEANNEENSEESNLTNEQSQNTDEEETNQNTINENTITQEPTIQPEESIELGEIQVGSKLYTKNELQVTLRPLLNSMKIETLPANQEVTILDSTNLWAYISVNDKTGWVRRALLTTVKQEETTKKTEKEEKKETNSSNKIGYVSTDGLNVRKEPNTNSKVLDVLEKNAKVTILQEEGSWYKVKQNGQEGYILKKYISEKKVTTTSRSATTREEKTKQEEKIAETKKEEKSGTTTEKNNHTTTVPQNASSKGSAVVAMAKKYLGSRYVYGGASPSGFDCSGFTMYIYKQFGISLPHSAAAQSNKGTRVEKSNLQLGDIVFFKNYRTNTGIGHCGIYIGNHQFIHASTEKTGVITSSLNSSSYQKRYVTAIRVF